MQPNHVDADSIIDFLGTSTNKFMRVSDVIKNSNVFACVSILADDLAKLPIHTYYGDGDRTKGMKHPVAELLYTRPNHLMSAFTLKQTLQMWDCMVMPLHLLTGEMMDFPMQYGH